MPGPTHRLADRTCLIVGGTSGIGLASAGLFLREGARVVVTGPSPEPPAGSLDPLRAFGDVSHLSLNLEPDHQPDLPALFDQAVTLLGGRLDVLLHVAGISGRRYGDGPLDACTDAGWDAVMSVNARGVFLTNREAVRRMLAQPIDGTGLRGSIVNVGSVLSGSPSPTYFGTIAYAASKGAVRSLSLAAAARYAGDRIRVNLIEPGLIDTPMSGRAVNDPQVRRYLATKQPLAGGPGTPDDVAEAALYLGAPASRFVTGVVLDVDGGWRLSDGQHPTEDVS